MASFSSGLVSLNVHEALAFDGTEICLHPDLFATATTPHYEPRSSSSRAQSILTTNSSGPPSAAVLKQQAQDSTRTSLQWNASQEDSATTLSAPPPPPPLQPGDLIELCVWDVVTTTTNNNNSPGRNSNTRSHHNHDVASILRPSSFPSHRHTIATTATLSTTTTHNNDATTTKSLQGEAISTESQSSHQHQLNSSRASSSMQYSPTASLATTTTTTNEVAVPATDTAAEEDASSASAASQVSSLPVTPQASPRSSSHNKTRKVPSPPPDADGLSSPPTKSVVTGVMWTTTAPSTTTTTLPLPPVFPRRSTTATTTDPAGKPPLIRRGGTGGEAKTTTRHKQPSRHHRDISDMTMESAMMMEPSLRSYHDDGDLLQLRPSTSSASAEEDDDDHDDDTTWHTSTLPPPVVSHTLRQSFVMQVTAKSLTAMPSKGQTRVSLLRKVADLYGLSSFDMVTVHPILVPEEKQAVLERVSADFVMVTVKDQFISRGDMHVFQESLLGTWIYQGQRLEGEPRCCVQAYAREIRHADQQAPSGIVTAETTITFRSQSSRIIWLVQMSSEMYDYASPYEPESTGSGGDVETSSTNNSRCDLYFDKLITFWRRLFAKWKELEVTHSLTVVFFSRTFVGGPQVSMARESGGGLQRDVYGRQYEDHFRIIVENERTPDWDSLVVRFKEAFIRYPSEVGWNLKLGDEARRPSSASQGNVLEAINVTLNLLQYHYLDRDLHRTGNSIVVISASSGIFEVGRAP